MFHFVFINRDDEVRFQLMEGNAANSSLKISVLDDADSRPELVGDAMISLNGAYNSRPSEGYDKWHQLSYKGKYAGEVYLEMTFYPAQPRKHRKQASRDSSILSSSISSDLNSSCMSSHRFSVSSRPLPVSPTKGGNLAAGLGDSLADLRMSRQYPSPNHVFAASVSSATPAPLGHAPLPTSLSVPAISDLASSISPRAPPHRNSLYEHGSRANMPSLASTDAQIAHEIDMPAIPPEPPQHQSTNSSPKPAFSEFFSKSIDNTSAENTEGTDKQATGFYSSIARLLPSTASFVPSLLSQSAGSDTSTEKDTVVPDDRRSPVRRKPVDSGPGQTSAPILPYPGATYSTDPGAPSLPDDEDRECRSVPFSADSYVSTKPELSPTYPNQQNNSKPSSSPPKPLSQPVSDPYQLGNGNMTRSGLRQPTPYLESVTRTSSTALPAPAPPVHRSSHRDPLAASISSNTVPPNILPPSLAKSMSVLSGPRKPNFSRQPEIPSSQPIQSYQSGRYDENYQFYGDDDYYDDYGDDGCGFNPAPVSVYQNRNSGWS